MIACIFHEGSGLGNQLHRYVAMRCLAHEKGYEFGVINPENFKGTSFLNLDMGVPVHDLLYEFNEKKVVENGIDIRSYDPEINFVKDFTLVDGEFQDERYFKYTSLVRNWLQVEPIDKQNICVINFRGGEYVGVPDLFLPQEYWDKAIEIIKQKNHGQIEFEVHTDDSETACKFFPDYKIVSDIGLNWRSIRYASDLILSNSSFAILPSIIGFAQNIIVPKYWARYNTKVWALPQNYYKHHNFIYIHHDE